MGSLRRRGCAFLVAVTLVVACLRGQAAATEAPASRARQVDLLAQEPNLTYFVLDSEIHPKRSDTGVRISSLRRLCTAPCTIAFEPGSYTLGVARENGHVVTVPPLSLQGQEVLEASYKSRSGMRLGVFLGSALIATIGGFLAFSSKLNGSHESLGSAIFSVGLLGTVTPFFIEDRARITPIAR